MAVNAGQMKHQRGRGAIDMSADDRTEELRRMKQEALQSGGPERIAARRKNGTGTARERVLQLLDPDTFVELDVFVEGVVTGHGKVDGRDVYVFSQDGEVVPDGVSASGSPARSSRSWTWP